MKQKHLNMLKNDPEFKALVLDPIILDMAEAVPDVNILNDSWEIVAMASRIYLKNGGKAATTIAGPYEAIKFHLGAE